MPLVSVEGKGFRKIDGDNREYDEGSETHLVVRILRKVDRPLTAKQIASMIERSREGRRLLSTGQVQDIEERVRVVIQWLRSESYISEEDGMVVLI